MTEKPQIKAYLETEDFEKIKTIAKKEGRSTSNLVAYLIKKHIKRYEEENGSIDTSTSTAKVSINKVEQNGPGTINIG